MISKSQIKLLQSLDQKKYRRKYNLFLAEGVKIVNELLISDYKIESIYATSEWLSENIGKARKINVSNVHEITTEEIKQISSLTSPGSVIASVQIPVQNNKVEGEIVIALDSIRDPGNLGTIIRIADWYGIKTIICSTDCVDVYNSKVIQATMGSFIRVNVISVELNEFFQGNTRFNVYGAVLNGENVHKIEPQTPLLILIGNESNGINPELLSFINRKVSIPKVGKAESLNASVATGILTDYFTNKLKK